MANGIDWFRWHHGTVTDPKFQLVARKSGASVGEVIAVWACLLEAASSAADRGNPGDIDWESLDCALGLEDGRTAAIYLAMEQRGLVDQDTGRLASWDKRQPKRERDDNSAQRTREYRQRKASACDADKAESGHVTPSDATERQSDPRGEESREEEKHNPANAGLPGIEDSQPPSGHPKLVPPVCPHQEIIALYHEKLPTATRVRVWNETRTKHLQARWREDPKRQSLEWWGKLFDYCAQSDFLTGQANTAPGRDPFVMGLDWLVKPENFAKVIEGKYHRSVA